MSNARGNWRGGRLINSTKWRKQQSPPEEEEEADPRREQKIAQGLVSRSD